MKKVTTGIFAGALSVFVLAWAFDAMGRIGHESAGRGHHDAALSDAGPAEETEFAANGEFAETGPSGEFTDILDHDPAERGGARTGLSSRALSSLELTDEQREKVKSLRSEFTRDMIRLRAESRLARVELREMMNETSPDVNRVKELAAAVSAAQGSVFERGAVFRAEFKNVLTPEQQEKLRESFRGRRDGRRDTEMRWQRGGRESRNRR